MDMEVKVMKKIVGVILAIFVLLPASLVGELSLKQSVREKLEIVKELAPKAIATHIVISEVFYDETGTDYNEFVELYNPTTAAVDISGWSLKHYNQAGSLQWTRTFPSGATIPKYGFYLIGQKSPLDSTDWGGTAIIPDNLTAGSLQNGPGDYAVLENAAGSYVDGVKWGDDTTVADPPLIQDTPTRSDVAPDVSGDSIERRPGETNSTGGNGVDTDNNLNDFLQRATPEPQNTTSPPETPSEGPPPAEHVTINEILYNSLYPEPAGEFIELYNGNNTTAFCIDGWNISDGEGNWQILNPTSGNDYVIQPKEHVIIANDGTRFFLNYNFYPDFEKSGSTPAVDLSIWETVALKNTGDEVILNNSDGKVIDVVVWELGSYGSVVPYNASEANGESIQRMPEGYEGSETPDATSPTGHDEATENMSSGVFIKGKPTPRSADKNPPTISNVSVDARSTIAVITWKTNDSDIWPEINPYATTEVIYSPNTNPDSTSNLTAIDNAYVTEHGIMLTNLKPSTTYYFYVKSVDGLGHVAIDKNASNYYKFTTAPPDYNAPVLTSGPTATVTNTTVIIKWITEEDSTSVVFYGTSTDLVYASSNLILTKNHEVTLYDLQASTTYYYEIKSEDPSENIMVANNNGAYYTFTTGTVLSLNYYLGMFHCHTELSDGEGTPDEAYAWARDTAKIDALMISDHSHMLDSDTAADPNAEITQIWNSANTYNSDGVFVAICGQENGNLGDKGFGHHNAYNTNVVMRPQTYQANGDVRHNWTNATNWLINNNTLSHFCHPRIDYGTNFDAFRYIPAADPYMFGLELLNGKRSEDYEDYYIQCLDKGWHVGALGSQDNHHKWWGNQANNYGKIPLTVFIAPSLTRANTLEALRTMQIYAVEINNTTALEVNRSDMPILSFTVNGYRMGEIFNVSTALKFNISLYKTSGNFQDVWLFEDGRVIESYYGVGTNSFIWRPTVKPKPGSHYYFVKATDTEDDRLWSTPIWVNTPVLALPDEIPSVSNVEHSCVKANFTDKVTVTAKITDDKSIARARVWYSAGSGVYGNIKMVDDGLTNSDALPNDKIYTAQIPVQENGSSVKYYVEVIDSSGQSGISPRAAPTYFYSYFVGPHVVINEVYSDAPGNETAEFIELYNPTSSEISLANWTIQDEYGGWYEDKWAFPSTASIAAGGFVVIARAAGSPIWGFIQNFSANPTYEYGYSSGLDNASIPNLIPVDADSEIKLDNSYDALHLCNAYGVLVDQVEYGSEGVGVLGTYMADPDEGKSISRDANGYDSDDCIVDFGILAAPSPFNKNNLPPKVWDVKHTAPEAGKATTVTVKIHDEAIWTTELWYSVNAGAYTKLTLSVASENLYSAEIPAQSNGTFVSYYIRVNDTEPQTTLAPENAPAENYTYLVGPHIVINEIYVNPPTDYDGAEFIELYNPTDQWINVSGWRLCDEPWEWADIWEFPADLSQTNISPKGFLVVAKDAGDPVKDNDGFYQEFGFLPDFEMVDPDRTYEFDNLSCPNLTQITQNSYDNQIRLDNYPYGDAVYLINKAGMIVDCIEYHTVLSANDTKNHAPGLVALAPWKGYSLTRDVLESDTDNCSQDFFLAPPTPKANASKTFYYFKAGWNLISVPFANTTYTNAQQLAKTIPGCKQIGKWNSTTQSFDIYTLRSWEEGFVLEAGGSYLVYVETYTGLQIYNKALTSQQVNLVAKWNSIGPLKKDIKASALATGIGANCIAIATWNTSSGRFITHPVSTGISDFVVQRGEGCFVFVSVATAWANEL